MKGIIIARVSKHEQAKEERHSLPVQIKKLEEYAKYKGIEVIEIFEIGGESAFKGTRRKFMKALKRAEAIIRTEPVIVLFYDYDRFSRDVTSESMRKAEELRQAGVEFYFHEDNKTINKNSRGRDLVNWKEEVLRAEKESAIKGDKIKDSIAYKLEKNEYPGFTPTGYYQPFREDGKKVIVIDEPRAKLIKELFEMYATGNYSLVELLKIFRQKGLTIKPKKNKEPRILKKSDVYQILTCKTYTGWFDWNGVEYHASNYKPIIPRRLFNKVQKVLQDKAIRYSTKHVSTSKFFKFRGMLKCGYCGCTLTPDDLSSRYKNLKPGEKIIYRCTYGHKQLEPDYYKDMFGTKHSGATTYKGKEVYNCPQRFWTEEEVEKQIKGYLKKLSFDKKIIQEIKQKIGVEFKEKMSAITLQKTSIEAEVAQRQKLIEGLIDKLAMSELQDLTEDIQKRIRKVKAEVIGLKAQLETVGEVEDSGLDEVIEALSLTSDLYERFDKLSPMDKRRVVISSFSEITLKKGWVGSEENAEEVFTAKWTDLFHQLWFKWVKDNLKNLMTKEQIEHEVEYQEWIDQLDEKYLEDTEVEEDEEEDEEPSRGEDIVKMNNSIWRAGRARDIFQGKMRGKAGIERSFLAGETERVFAITNWSSRNATHYGFGNVTY